MSVLYIRFPEGKSRAVTFSYDDGVIQDKRLIEIFNKYGLRATFNLNTQVFLRDFSKDTYNESWHPFTMAEAVLVYKESGHEAALHTHTHPNPVSVTREEMAWEIMKNREILEKEFGGIITGMAYPYGNWNESTLEVLRACGVSYSRTVKATHSFEFPPENWLTLHPTCHHDDPEIFNIIDRFFKTNFPKSAYPGMLYIWGHSYEFYRNNNWEHIEKICKAVSGKEDVWYATNIELYRYEKAFRSLEKNLECTEIYNPSAVDLWALRTCSDKSFASELIKIPAGQTLKL